MTPGPQCLTWAGSGKPCTCSLQAWSLRAHCGWGRRPRANSRGWERDRPRRAQDWAARWWAGRSRELVAGTGAGRESAKPGMVARVLSRSVASDSARLRTVARLGPLSTGFSRQELLRWVAVPFFRGSSRPRDRARVSQTGSACWFSVAEAGGVRKSLRGMLQSGLWLPGVRSSGSSPQNGRHWSRGPVRAQPQPEPGWGWCSLGTQADSRACGVPGSPAERWGGGLYTFLSAALAGPHTTGPRG